MNEEKFGNNEDNFLDLGKRIDEDVSNIRQNMAKFDDLKVKLGLSIEYQKKLIQSLDKAIKINENA